MPNDHPAHATMPPEARIQTPMGTVCIAFVAAGAVRVMAGRDVGWLRLDGVPIYATALLREKDGAWVVDPVHSAVTSVADNVASDPVPPPVRDTAWKVLQDTFETWLSGRPDVPARIAASARRAAVAASEERVATLLAEVERLRAEMPTLLRLVQETEAELERAIAGMDPSPEG